MRKQQNFANPTVTSTYAGEFAGKYISAALFSAKTLDNKYITIMPNVKYKSVIQKVAIDNAISNASCDFTATGSVALTERVITPKELQVNIQLCKADFLTSWEALQLGYSAFDTIPASITDYLVSYVGAQVAQATEIAIWQGVEATNGSFGGIYTALSSSVGVGGATAPVTASASGSITSTNVIAALNSVYNAIPAAIYGKDDLKIFVPTNVAKAYQQAVGQNYANGYMNQVTIGEVPMNFQGVELAWCPGLANNGIVAAQSSNLFFGTGLLSDYQEVKVLDMADLDGSQNYRVIMRYTAGTQFGIGQDIVVYKNY
jgi:hypothetical protein